MSTYSEVSEKKLSLTDVPDELLKKVRRSVGLSIGNSQKVVGGGGLFHVPQQPPEPDKRARREIANSNERRRMQSINSGFDTLKKLLPTEDGEKLSKAAILQLTSKYINHLVGENRRMRDQLVQLQHQQQHQPQPQPQQPPPQTVGDAPDGGGGGGVYIGYYQNQQQQQQHPPQATTPTFQLTAPPTTAQQLQQQQQQQTATVLVKPDYEQFAVEPPVSVAASQQQQQSTAADAAAKRKRLDHLMRAIEQIEGKRALLDESPTQTQPQQQPQPPAMLMVSPFTPQQQQQRPLSSPTGQQSEQDDEDDDMDEDNEEPEDCLVAGVDRDNVATAATAARLVIVDLAGRQHQHQQQQQQGEEEDASAAASLWRPRAIPHKYLHRPQVVQANRSN